MTNKAINKIIMIGLIILSFLAYSCMPPPDFSERRTLMIDYELEDDNLARPSAYETNPARGRHIYDDGTTVFLTETSIYYGISKWKLYDLDSMTFIRDFHQAPVQLRMNQNYYVEAVLHCVKDEACRRGICLDNECVEQESEVHHITGEYIQGDEQILGNNLAELKRIGTEAILISVNNMTRAVSLGSSTVYEEINVRVKLNDVLYDIIPPENCTQNITDSSAALSIKKAYNESENEDRFIPRIMYWWGKVNQHWDLNEGRWKTDPDGVSGANIDMLTYCNKFYPGIVDVIEYKNETTDTWKDRGNTGNYTSTKTSYECYRRDNEAVPRIMYWAGKVNQHWDVNTRSWQTDPDGVSGADIDMLTYCKKFYPNTLEVFPYKYETIDTWKNRGNLGNYTSTKLSFECVEPSSQPRTVFLNQEETTNMFNNEITLQNVSNEFAIVKVNNDYKQISAYETVLFQEYNLNVKVEAIFFTDTCQGSYDNFRANITFTYVD